MVTNEGSHAAPPSASQAMRGASPPETSADVEPSACGRPACPVCGGGLIEIRQKLHCAVCRSIVETCCEGGRG